MVADLAAGPHPCHLSAHSSGGYKVKPELGTMGPNHKICLFLSAEPGDHISKQLVPQPMLKTEVEEQKKPLHSPSPTPPLCTPQLGPPPALGPMGKIICRLSDPGLIMVHLFSQARWDLMQTWATGHGGACPCQMDVFTERFTLVNVRDGQFSVDRNMVETKREGKKSRVAHDSLMAVNTAPVITDAISLRPALTGT